MTSDTMFALHSMTKPITSLAATMLIELGRLSLTDPVSKYIPTVAAAQVGVDSKTENGTSVLKLKRPNRPNRPTIEDLLRHTSGITLRLHRRRSDREGRMPIFFRATDNKEFAVRVARQPLAPRNGFAVVAGLRGFGSLA
jgi:CubicO group peptidase (beta-lactamase class C family)